MRSTTSATARGLGYTHQRRRRALLPAAIGKPCPLCGDIMLKEHALDLDHTLPRALGGTHGDRITHARCNRQSGGRLGAARRWAGHTPPPPLTTSRPW